MDKNKLVSMTRIVQSYCSIDAKLYIQKCWAFILLNWMRMRYG